MPQKLARLKICRPPRARSRQHSARASERSSEARVLLRVGDGYA
jgi:hypothetical protein